MSIIKVGDTVRIITPIAIFHTHPVKADSRTNETSFRKRVLGKKAEVVFVSKAKDPLIKVRIKAKVFFTSRFTGWEFKKINIFNITI